MKSGSGAVEKRIHRAMFMRRCNAMDPGRITAVVRQLMTTRPDEIGCDECFEQVDRFVDTVLAGKNAAEAVPLVQDHLAGCTDCRAEYEALLAAVS
jgi:hypothetical protein